MTEEEINYVLSPERMLQPGEDKELQKKIEERLGWTPSGRNAILADA